MDRVLIAHCPERVLPGRILVELVQNDRVVGGINEASTAAAAAFYREFVNGEVLETTAATAEMAKLTENTYRDVNIALANELSMICDRFDIDVFELIRLANRHPRVDILQPGPGVGGHCIAVDPWFIVEAAPEEARLIRTAREVNDGKPDWVLAKVREKAARFSRPTIACLGLAFKADVDDLRESPALHIVARLREADLGELLVCEPNLRRSDEFDLVPLRGARARRHRPAPGRPPRLPPPQAGQAAGEGADRHARDVALRGSPQAWATLGPRGTTLRVSMTSGQASATRA